MASVSNNKNKQKNSKVYAVAFGKQTGVFPTWFECEKQVKGVKGAKFKSFWSQEEALDYLEKNAAATATAGSKRSHTGSGGSVKIAGQQEDATDAGSNAEPNNNNNNKRPCGSNNMRRDVSFPYVKVRMTVMFDGGSRGNPGTAGSGALVQSVCTQVLRRKGETEHFRNRRTVKVRHFLGNHGITNNRAEYEGLICGLERAVLEARQLIETLTTTAAVTDATAAATTGGGSASNNIRLACEIHGDSQVVIRQMTGEYACRHPTLQPCKARADRHVAELQSLEVPGQVQIHVRFHHVLREFNKEADALGNEAMDARQSWITVTNDEGELENLFPNGDDDNEDDFWGDGE